jgi:O-antigen/teichoic acid export membrane protein
VLIQGMRKLEYLAKANLYGSFVGLFITIPIYYKFGIEGIVPSIILSSLISLIGSWYYTRKLDIKPANITLQKTLSQGKSMLVFGLVISITSLFPTIGSYLLRVFINRGGGLSDVGLYTAGFSIVTIYLGMIFNAMGTDYYPRLSEISNDNIKSKEVINQQAEITILILSPILIFFFVFIKLVVVFLYGKSFLSITDMMLWSSLGMFFKASTWPMVFLFLAKGESKVYFFNELSSNIYNLILSIIGYKLLGLKGLGIAFFGAYLLTFIQVIIIMKIKHEFFYSFKFIKIFVYQFVIAAITLLLVLFLSSSLYYILGIILICLSLWISYKGIEKRIGIKNILKIQK